MSYFEEMWEGSGTNDNHTEPASLPGNLNASCAVRFDTGPLVLPYSAAFTTTVRILQALLFSILALVGSTLNTLVLVLVAKYRALHTTTHLVSLQVVVLSLLLSLISVISLANTAANRWLLGEHVCIATGFFITASTTLRTLLMCVFVLDRYFSVTWPFCYPKHRRKVATVLSLSSWLISFVLAILSVPAILDCYAFKQNSWLCGFEGGCSISCSIYATVLYGGTHLPVTILPIFFYSILYCKARKIRRNMAALSGAQKAEWKATITFFLLFLTVFLMTVPSTTISIAISAVYIITHPPPAVYLVQVFAAAVIYLVVLTDPLVIMRNADVRQVLSKIKITIRGKKSTNENNT